MLKSLLKLAILFSLLFCSCEKKNDYSDVSISVNLYSDQGFNYRYEDFETYYTINGSGNHQFKLKFVLYDSNGTKQYESHFFDTVKFNSDISNSQSLWNVRWFNDLHPTDFYDLENNRYFIQLFLVDLGSDEILVKSDKIAADLNRENPDTTLIDNFVLLDIDGQKHELVKILENKNFVLLFHFAVWCGWSKVSIPDMNYIDSVYASELSIFGIEGSITNASQSSGLIEYKRNYGIKFPIYLNIENSDFNNVLPLKMTSFPNFLLLNNNRKLVYQQIGYSDNLLDSIDFYVRGN